jgi:hypothetical protein
MPVSWRGDPACGTFRIVVSHEGRNVSFPPPPDAHVVAVWGCCRPFTAEDAVVATFDVDVVGVAAAGHQLVGVATGYLTVIAIRSTRQPA